MRLRNSIPTAVFFLTVLPALLIFTASISTSITRKYTMIHDLEKITGHGVSFSDIRFEPCRGFVLSDLNIHTRRGITVSCAKALFHSNREKEPMLRSGLSQCRKAEFEEVTVSAEKNASGQMLTVLASILSTLGITESNIHFKTVSAQKSGIDISLDDSDVTVHISPGHDVIWQATGKGRFAANGVLDKFARFQIFNPDIIRIPRNYLPLKSFLPYISRIHIFSDETSNEFKLVFNPDSIRKLPYFKRSDYPAQLFNGNISHATGKLELQAERFPNSGIFISRLTISPTGEFTVEYRIEDVDTLNSALPDFIPLSRLSGFIQMRSNRIPERDLFATLRKKGSLLFRLKTPEEMEMQPLKSMEIFSRTGKPDPPSLDAEEYGETNHARQKPFVLVREIRVDFNVNSKKSDLTFVFNNSESFEYTINGRMLTITDIRNLIALIFN